MEGIQLQKQEDCIAHWRYLMFNKTNCSRWNSQTKPDPSIDYTVVVWPEAFIGIQINNKCQQASLFPICCWNDAEGNVSFDLRCLWTQFASEYVILHAKSNQTNMQNNFYQFNHTINVEFINSSGFAIIRDELGKDYLSPTLKSLFKWFARLKHLIVCHGTLTKWLGNQLQRDCRLETQTKTEIFVMLQTLDHIVDTLFNELKPITIDNIEILFYMFEANSQLFYEFMNNINGISLHTIQIKSVSCEYESIIRAFLNIYQCESDVIYLILQYLLWDDDELILDLIW